MCTLSFYDILSLRKKVNFMMCLNDSMSKFPISTPSIVVNLASAVCILIEVLRVYPCMTCKQINLLILGRGGDLLLHLSTLLFKKSD